jgi:hypothetical protein
MHRPSVSQNLDHPDELWARATTPAVLRGAGLDGDAYRLSEDGLYCDNAGGSYWWRLRVYPDGRALFSGQDADGSHGHLRVDPVDFLAGGPKWLPWERLRGEVTGDELGYLYWWQDGRWGRAPYPDDLEDDGLAVSAPWAGDGRAVVEALQMFCTADDLDGVLQTFMERARTRTVDQAAVRALVSSVRPHGPQTLNPEKAIAFAIRAGLMNT